MIRRKRLLRLLITAGPTAEPLDPVRFISNRSTGYMGYELARLAGKKGYSVTLISGPTALKPPNTVRFISIKTARELEKETRKELRKHDILVMSSAVSDYRPLCFSRRKIKGGKRLTVKFVRNPDILASISTATRKGKILVGFSLETDNLMENAEKKLEAKHLDLIIANRLSRRNVPFGGGKKTVYLVDKYGRVKMMKNVTKSEIARAILDTIEELCYTPG